MRALIVDSNGDSRDALRRAFAAAGAQVRSFAGVDEGRRQLSEFSPEVVVVALDSNRGESWSLLAEAALHPGRAVYALVDRDLSEDGVEAMERGASDWLWRPVSERRVRLLLARLSQSREREQLAEQTRLGLARAEMSGLLPGNSARWREALAEIEREAPLGASVLLTGESGTEKPEAARMLHHLSPRGSEAFVAGEPTEVLRSAGDLRRTLFVSRIEQMSVAAQRQLVARVENPSELRLVLATDLEPGEAMTSGRLCPELMAAFGEHAIHLPPLRERGRDIGILARHFLSQIDGSLFFEPEALDALSAHDWPGNVAELKAAVLRASDLTDGPAIGSTVVLSVLPRPRAARRVRHKKPPVVRIPVGASLADVERRLIQKTLEFARGSKPKTAELLKLSLKTIYNKIKQYGLEH